MTPKLISVFAMLAVTGCKFNTSSNTESHGIESFKTDSEAQICDANVTPSFDLTFDTTYWKDSVPKEQRHVDARDKYKPYIKEAMSAVHPGLQDWYYRAGGSIKLVKDAEKNCLAQDEASIFLIDHQGAITGCLIGTNKIPKVWLGVSDELITMDSYQGDAETKLREDLSHVVQAYGLINGFYTTTIGAASRQNQQVIFDAGKSDRDLMVRKLEIAHFLLYDMARDPEIMVPEIYQALLTDKELLDRATADTKKWKKLWELVMVKKDPGATSFVNYVFSQVYTSMECNENSRRMLVGKDAPFKQTGLRYTRYLEKDLTSAFDQNYASTTTQVTQLGLTAARWNFPVFRGIVGFFRTFQPVRNLVVRPVAGVVNWVRVHKPVRSFFRTHKPIRRTLGFVLFGRR